MSSRPASPSLRTQAPARAGARDRPDAGAGVLALVPTELAKIASTRAVWGLLGGALALALLGLAGALDTLADARSGTLSDTEVRQVFVVAGAGSVFSLALGILVMAGEFRHGVAEATFLATPARSRVLAAKAVAAGLAGVGYAVVCTVLVLAVGVPWLSGEGRSVALGDGELWRVLGGVAVASALYGMIGVAVGTLVRNLAGAMIVGLGWVLAVESALLELWLDGARYLPGGAAEALGHGTRDDLVAQGWGGLLLAGWTLALLMVAAWDLERRDVGA